MNTIFSPSNIEVLLYFHSRADPHPRQAAPAVAEAIVQFMALGVLARSKEPGCFETTPLGRAWVEALCNTPPPVLRFTDQSENLLETRP